MTRASQKGSPRAALRRAALAAGALLLGLAAQAADGPDVLSLTMKRLDGGDQDLASYKGRVVLIVNTASKCGFTPQYEGLEALYRKYQARGFVVLGFPSNDFKQQEPGSDAQIQEFCRATYDVQFPMFSKISVKGDTMHPLYRMLTSLPAPLGGPVAWNFQKYLVDRSGHVVAKFAPNTTPEDPALVSKLETLLAQTP
jgi:glutathione peroxidase